MVCRAIKILFQVFYDTLSKSADVEKLYNVHFQWGESASRDLFRSQSVEYFHRYLDDQVPHF